MSDDALSLNVSFLNSRRSLNFGRRQSSARSGHSHLVRQDLEIIVKHRYQGTFSIAGWTDVFGVSYLRLPALIGRGIADIFL